MPDDDTATVQREPNRPRSWPGLSIWLLGVIAAVLVGWALRATGIVLIPVVLSIFTALVLAPVDRGVATWMPKGLRWLGHLAAIGLLLLIMAFFVGGLWIAAQRVIENFSNSGEIGAMLPSIDGGGSSGASAGGGSGVLPASISRLAQTFAGAGGTLGSTVIDWASGMAQGIVNAAGVTAATAVLVVFLTLLMLVDWPQWRHKLSAVLAPSQRGEWFESTEVIARQVRRYLLVRVVMGLATSALYALWLWLLGIHLLVVWVLITFLLSFIPNLGSLVAGILPVLYALLQTDPTTALLVGAGIFVIEQVMGNYIDPQLQGREVALSPLVILIVLLFWGWIWGIVGTLLAVPMTIAVVIVCTHIRPLRPVALLLSNVESLEALDEMARR